MATFGTVRQQILAQAKVDNHFAYMDLGKAQEELWEELNAEEYKRGYVKGEYEKPGTPSLCDRELLTEAEAARYVERGATLASSR